LLPEIEKVLGRQILSTCALAAELVQVSPEVAVEVIVLFLCGLVASAITEVARAACFGAIAGLGSRVRILLPTSDILADMHVHGGDPFLKNVVGKAARPKMGLETYVSRGIPAPNRRVCAKLLG
jgi:hypothetical protein